MKALDLFCGRGGWTKGFVAEGFDVDGLDIVNVGYKGRLIRQDIRTFEASSRKGQYDVVVASPPCQEFSQMSHFAATRGLRKEPDPAKGMELVNEGIRVIRELSPRYWALENVRGAVKHIQPVIGKPRIINGPWFIWGTFPGFLLPDRRFGKPFSKGIGIFRNQYGGWKSVMGRAPRWKDISAIRAEIPLPISQGLAHACKEAIMVKM